MCSVHTRNFFRSIFAYPSSQAQCWMFRKLINQFTRLAEYGADLAHHYPSIERTCQCITLDLALILKLLSLKALAYTKASTYRILIWIWVTQLLYLWRNRMPIMPLPRLLRMFLKFRAQNSIPTKYQHRLPSCATGSCGLWIIPTVLYRTTVCEILKLSRIALNSLCSIPPVVDIPFPMMSCK